MYLLVDDNASPTSARRRRSRRDGTLYTARSASLRGRPRAWRAPAAMTIRGFRSRSPRAVWTYWACGLDALQAGHQPIGSPSWAESVSVQMCPRHPTPPVRPPRPEPRDPEVHAHRGHDPQVVPSPERPQRARDPIQVVQRPAHRPRHGPFPPDLGDAASNGKHRLQSSVGSSQAVPARSRPARTASTASRADSRARLYFSERST